MNKIFLIIGIIYFTQPGISQNNKYKISNDSIMVENSVEFFIYKGPYGQREKVKEPAVRFILTIKNLGTKPIPDVDVTNRSQYVNLYINDSIDNPVSMYNGIEEKGPHLLKKGESDSYTWWLFEKDAYANIYTVQWQYKGIFSKKIKVDHSNKTAEVME